MYAAKAISGSNKNLRDVFEQDLCWQPSKRVTH
ncbi:hypothetical protein PEC301645_12890 [Pectobacterium carotovorum subsp. carotovorum]|uniref:Uncharacterized protein n=1 Tax=Pectobacterium carotovorum subsp. carotovorum (strain PC1) TaxID=561230 RepID=C6DBG0_PECCP|nr:hypothetical protein PC1_3000 [Pectobacterium carotovorum subsp. carotovorum PC1]GKV93842.1 hypothetical protein PEC301645_12890 [Pectobacterium carotovorum subsp. carotovorum]